MLVSDNYSNINFAAKPIMTGEILKRVSHDSFLPHNANIIELSFASKEDSRAIDDVYRNWKGAEYTAMITSPSNRPSRKIYAITDQQTAFDTPESDKILGLADVEYSGTNAHLRFLQVDPEIKNDPNRNIKHVGQALVQSLVNYFRGLELKTMDLYSLDSKKPFYEKILPNIKNKTATPESSTNMILDL